MSDMIARHEHTADKGDIWAQLSAPLPAGVISWRQDGRPAQRDGKYFARFVAYIEANTVRERLDNTVPGEWDLTLDLLPMIPMDEQDSDTACSFKARLQVLGVIREDVGTGKDYKQAATDAFKRVAVRYGIGHELYSYEQNWVQVDGDGKYAKALEDPSDAYARRMARSGGNAPASPSPKSSSASTSNASKVAKLREETEAVINRPAASSIDERAPLDDEQPCPKCGGKTWDNRKDKKNPKAPDYKCRDKSCDGVIWPPKPAKKPVTTPDDIFPPDTDVMPWEHDD